MTVLLTLTEFDHIVAEAKADAWDESAKFIIRQAEATTPELAIERADRFNRFNPYRASGSRLTARRAPRAPRAPRATRLTRPRF